MKFLDQLVEAECIPKETSSKIEEFERSKPLSIHWELRVILYLGVMLLATGLGILVYENIDTIGHLSIIIAMSVACGACFFYCFRNRLPYSHGEIKYPSPFFDYILLLACLLLGILLGYVQYQYELFGTHYGLATLIPTLIYLFCAYTFDHKGILSLGITGICAWVGVSITPFAALDMGYYLESDRYYYTGLGLGVLFALVAWISEKKLIKPHFGFSYNNFAALLFFSSTLAALIDKSMLFVLPLAGAVVWYIRYARERKSFLFLLYSVLYGYIGFTYIVMETIFDSSYSDEMMTLVLFYYMASAGGVVVFFMKYKKILGIKK